MSTKVRIPREHFLLYRKIYRYLHETQGISVTDQSFLDFSKQLLSHYLGRHSKRGDSNYETERVSLIVDAAAQPKPEHDHLEGPLHKMHQKIYHCEKCFLGKRRKNAVALPKLNSPLMVITDLPSFYDETQGHYFRDEAGKLLVKIVESLGVDFRRVYYTGAIKCASAIEVSNQLEKIAPCRDYLYQELLLIQPKFVIAFGEDVYRFLEKHIGQEDLEGEVLVDRDRVATFDQLRGRLVKFFSVQGVVTYHPRELIFDPSLKSEVWNDLKPFREKILSYFRG